ncbi:hypothetical protein [Roseibium aggregatum]|uniref:hypothetical protein n=1 Tax=Roseibium aggregatum TaxID=187304 RepID=UPI0025AD31CB|nr:hypothetical protein [Roseibium aggregatum]WJS05868.1 hypothetical protein QUB73_28010 [Roseibium aggregatum]
MTDQDWDPFEGTVPHERDVFRAFAVGKWERKHKVVGMLGLSGLILWIALPLIGLTNVNWLGFAAAMGAGFWIALTIDTDFSGDAGAKDVINPLHRTAAMVAERADWGLSLIQPATTLNIPKGKALGKIPVDLLRKLAREVMRKNGREGLLSERQLSDLAQIDLRKTLEKSPSFLLIDRRVYSLTQDVKPVVMPSPVVAMPVHVRAVFRWQRNGLPLWTGIGAFKGDVRHPNTQGGRDFRNDVYTLAAIFAFPLSRDTGLDVSMLAAFPYIQGRDPQLDGQTFNRIYHIRLLKGDEFALYRALTPAAQTKLVDLFVSNGSEMLIRDQMVFVRALFTVPMSNNAEKVVQVAEEWHDKLGAFADELVELRTYLD